MIWLNVLLVILISVVVYVLAAILAKRSER